MIAIAKASDTEREVLFGKMLPTEQESATLQSLKRISGYALHWTTCSIILHGRNEILETIRTLEKEINELHD